MKLKLSCIVLLLTGLVCSQNGGIEFIQCKEIEDPEKKTECNNQELSFFIANNFKYPEIALKKKLQGKTIIRYSISEDGMLDFKIIDESKLDPSLNKELLRTMYVLKKAGGDGKVQIIPATIQNKPYKSSYLLPVNVELPQEQAGEKKMIIATYRTSEQTIQFRRDLNGNMYAYLLRPKEEKLLIKIPSNIVPDSLTKEEKSYFFLYNLTFVKPEVLLAFGNIEGKECEIYVDKEAGEDGKQVQINVYAAGTHTLIDTFSDIDQLFVSKYANILFK